MKRRSKRSPKDVRRRPHMHPRTNQESHKGKDVHQDGGQHHIIPQARGGSDKLSNLYRWKEDHHKKHAAWHNLFADLLASEAILIIEHWTRKDGQLDLRYFKTRKDRPNKRLLSWKTLFGGFAPSDAISWIEKEFIRKDLRGEIRSDSGEEEEVS